MTVISDGEAALPNLVAAAISQPVTHILDWFRISMRARPIEPAVAGLYARKPANEKPVGYLADQVDRLRHGLWNDDQEEAWPPICDLQTFAWSVVSFNGDRFEEAGCPVPGPVVRIRFLPSQQRRLDRLPSRRVPRGPPVSTSRGEGCVEEIANARMFKLRAMRWSAVGAHRVACSELPYSAAASHLQLSNKWHGRSSGSFHSRHHQAVRRGSAGGQPRMAASAPLHAHGDDG